jgi:putative ABC transport system permease protein
MFFTYLGRELRRRSKQAVVVAVGLAVGIGLVMTVSSASAGVKAAQGQVLHSLYGVGTAMTVTKSASFGSGTGQHFGFGGGGSSGSRPAAGTHVSRDTLRPTFGEATLPASDVSRVSAVAGVAAASGGLSLSDTSFSGTIPSGGSGQGGFAGGGGAPGAAGSSFDISSFSVDGVPVSGRSVGPLTATQITKGSYFTSSDNTADVAVLSSSYATSKGVGVGSAIDVAGTSVKVIGITSASASDVYIPLGTAQHLSGLENDVTTIYVSANSSSAVGSATTAVKAAVPGASVTTSASLAKEVSGSLSSASDLVTSLGKWLSILALLVAFLIAGLLMMAAVSRRVREFGTLKAIGWRTRRVVGQVMGEGLTLGLAGGALGILLGIGGAEIVSAISPSLTATVGSTFATGGSGAFPGGGGPAGGGGGLFNRTRATSGAHSVLVHLTAPLQSSTILVAVGLAVAGGLVAGAFGSWRAARLRPAAALRRVE